MEYYNQCTLVKSFNGGKITQVTWIPTKFAIAGRTVKLKNDQNVWVDGWLVESVGEKTPENLVPDAYDDIKAHRRATGDSLKKVQN